jgi:hypothetical protein
MARIKYSGLVDNIRGSIGGTTFQANAYGYTVKRKPNMIKPNSPDQNRSKVLFAKAVKAWKDLTSTNRSNWETYASTYPQYAKYNPDSELSGFAVFTKQHVFKFLCGQIVKSDPVMSQIESDTITVTMTLIAGVLRYIIASLNDSEEWTVIIFISHPLGAAQNFVGSRTRYIANCDNVDGSHVITSQYIALYGSLPAVGNRVAIDLLAFNGQNGQNIARQTTICTVAAA